LSYGLVEAFFQFIPFYASLQTASIRGLVICYVVNGGS